MNTFSESPNSRVLSLHVRTNSFSQQLKWSQPRQLCRIHHQCDFHEAACVGSDVTLLLAVAGGTPTATKETENELQSNTTTNTNSNDTQGLSANRSAAAATGNQSSG
jgi:hypothetical protein